MTPNRIGFSFLIIGAFLLAGKLIRTRTKWLQNLFLPSSIIGGFLALFLGPDVLGRLTSQFLNEASIFYNGLIPGFILDVWRPLSGLFINIIFAALLLAKPVPGIKKIWNNAGPQIVMAHTVAWGQYVVGLLLVLFVLTPVFGTDPLAGALIEIAFVGGHGTAAGLSDTFALLGYPEGADLALGLATVGIFGGVVSGIAIINIGFRKGYAKPLDEKPTFSDEEKEQIAESYGYDIEQDVKHAKAIEPLAFHLSLIAVAILFGYIFQQALILLEAYTWGAWTDVYLFTYMPLFPLAMIGGIIVQMIFAKLNLRNYIDPNIVSMMSGFALDVLLVSALATLSLDVIGDNIVPFLLISGAGIAWNLFAFLYLGPRMIPDHWFERGLGDFGQSTGMAATGLLLMKIADPDNRTPALEGFGYKQIMFEPFVGGGLVTSASLPLIYQFGPVTFLIITSVVTLFFLIFGLIKFKPKRLPNKP
ncbi:glutamate:Na+ symporter, ESS family [Alkalibacterium putridalgicola]|uniref:Glutamate:Na+ symporter, ESS family n=1 Tax=Alkalibacterium putridalgicola TaxID=426703 RepID=A0A1H7VKZ4_9LACT|nr:sodium/glutamate symporter [Alkalibacterium putridalgicola]GEK89416.1 sodium:glutamate symporter [Alkalibacterium putridalgicola]SEM09830.1 glutamate:Na+ symporter, ESS family [Alkalibacterium putridalgicola]